MRRKTVRLGAAACALLLAAIAADRPLQASAPCEALSRLALPSAAITIAQLVEAGGFVPPGGRADAARALPAFCRVGATLKPTSDSEIAIEVWMPASGWNGKFQAVGNGAFSGAIAYPALIAALARGYAASSTDTGHAGGSASFALGHPEKVIDFGWRAVHEMTVAAKTIIAAYYDRGPTRSYWNGCSAGGRQGMKAAQRFPADFDGIIAGAPGLDWTGRAAQAVRVAKALEQAEASRLLAPQTQLLHQAVIEACDPIDGLKDGLIQDPARCTFDPAVLQCKAGDSTGCLSAPQVETARLIYSAAVNPRSGREIPGLARGSELGWTPLGWTASARATGLDQFRFIVFKDPAWDIQRFTFDADIGRAEEVDAGTINALDPNLKPFIDRGGRLIQYHGWSDPQISPGNSTQYYLRVLAALGGAASVEQAYRLFMAPGMGHCGGGEGPNTFDMLAALEQWVEHGQAPDRIIASHAANGRVDRTRPLCPYPQVAVSTTRGASSAEIRSQNSEVRLLGEPHGTPRNSPREHLAEELAALEMSATGLARRLKVPTNRVTEILNGEERSLRALFTCRKSRITGRWGAGRCSLQLQTSTSAELLPNSQAPC
jgi:feruloyl esterase